MKLADLMAAADQSFPNLEFEIEREGQDPIYVVFRNVLRLSEERRTKLADLKAEAARGDNLTMQAEAEKQGLAQVIEDPEGIEHIEALFSQSPDDRDVLWLELSKAYAEATNMGEAEPSQQP